MELLQLDYLRMVKIILQYSITLILFFLTAILLMDYVILPSYVGFNNEHYLPDIRGEYVEKANHELKSIGFNSELIIAPFNHGIEPSTVIKMFPRAFTKVKEGRTITLTVSGKMENILIPNIIDETLRNAKLELSRLGLGIDTIIYEYDNNIPNGKITFQVPRPGKTVLSSTNITIGVSKGIPPDYYIVPDLINLSLQRGKQLIINSGLRLGDFEYDYQPELLNQTILEQSMTPGMRVSFPASINLLISIDRKIKQ